MATDLSTARHTGAIRKPRADYPKLSTLNDAVGYLAQAQRHLAGATDQPA